ncbi:MAG: hypothetical protein EHM14_08400 [Methanothrix sp.]|nr:MAG: hypothetical protein EHM14_08400 [Methanothrix sp.]
MKGKGQSVICILMAVIFLVPCAYSITVSVSSDKGSYSEQLGAGVQDTVSGFTTISKWGLTHSISSTARGRGTVNLKESHSVGNKLGSYVEVGVDIKKAKGYKYTYSLSPGEGTSFAKTYDPVAAGEALNVNGAQSALAYAKACNGAGYDVGVSTLVTNGDIIGYSNLAEASASGVCAFQSFALATGTIQLDSTARQLPAATSRSKAKLNSLELTYLPIASISTKVTGTVTNVIEGAAMKQADTQLQQDATIRGKYSSISKASGATPVTLASTVCSPTTLVRKAGIVDGVGSVDLANYVPPTTTTPTTSAKKILIRADDVWWSTPGFDWIKNIVASPTASTKLAATLAVVPISVPDVANYGSLAGWEQYYINWLQNLDPKYIEVAQHGYEHTSFKGETLTKQEGDMQTGMNLLKTAIGTSVTGSTANAAWRPYTFVPPYDEADTNTVLAAKDLGYHSISGQAVTGADTAIEQFVPSYYWEDWTEDGQFKGFKNVETEFKPAFNTFLTSSNDYFLIEIHPNLFYTDAGNGIFTQTEQQKADAAAFEATIKWMLSTGGDKIQFTTVEQAYQLDHATI